MSGVQRTLIDALANAKAGKVWMEGLRHVGGHVYIARPFLTLLSTPPHLVDGLNHTKRTNRLCRAPYVFLTSSRSSPRSTLCGPTRPRLARRAEQRVRGHRCPSSPRRSRSCRARQPRCEPFGDPGRCEPFSHMKMGRPFWAP